MNAFGWMAGIWGLVMVAVFIQAIRLSYRIEARSPALTNTSGFPRNAMIFLTVTNSGVARDAETQGMRRRMNLLLLVNLLGFALLGAGIYFSRLPEA
ncbi:hypothetical protein [Mesorhizobium sp. IMUNJ 23232]|uniref:hypothetical protein n=1 Tax=Mesorhizobium sp. IMUNJ 23232 TaxID=3376064 RepID=UPI0037AC9E76